MSKQINRANHPKLVIPPESRILNSEAKPGTLYQLGLIHDPDCPQLTGVGECNCKRDLVIADISTPPTKNHSSGSSNPTRPRWPLPWGEASRSSTVEGAPDAEHSTTILTKGVNENDVLKSKIK